MQLKAGNRSLVVFPDKRLRQKAAPVTVFNEALGRLASDLAAACQTFQGVAIAAPQIGSAHRVIVLRAELLDGAPQGIEYVSLINPEILRFSDEASSTIEGCLSFPGVFEIVRRPDSCVVRFQDPTGETHTGEAKGFPAHVIQHEIDHLDGKLMLDHLSPLKRDMIRRYAAKGFPKFGHRIGHTLQGLQRQLQRQEGGAR